MNKDILQQSHNIIVDPRNLHQCLENLRGLHAHTEDVGVVLSALSNTPVWRCYRPGGCATHQRRAKFSPFSLIHLIHLIRVCRAAAGSFVLHIHQERYVPTLSVNPYRLVGHRANRRPVGVSKRFFQDKKILKIAKEKISQNVDRSRAGIGYAVLLSYMPGTSTSCR